MSLFYNLVSGQTALEHVRRSGIRTNSRLEDMQRMSDKEWHEVGQCLADDPVGSVRGKFATFCQVGMPQPLPDNWSDVCLEQKSVVAIEYIAKLAQSKKCGNCMEQDAVALAYLIKMNVRPLDLMNLPLPIDHTFVVIGRDAPLHEVPNHKEKLCYLVGSVDEDPSTWGAEAVVLDPWHDVGKVYAATEIHQMMFRGYEQHEGKMRAVPIKGRVKPKSIWRLD